MKLTDRIIDYNTNKTRFKVYGLYNSEELIIPKYIGVTFRDPIERLSQHIHHAEGTPVINWIRTTNYNIVMRVLQYTETREEMYQIERKFIREYPKLLNTSKHYK